MKLGLAALGAGVALACVPSPAGPAPGTPVAIRQIGGGPSTGTVRLFAATSVAQLQGMVWASGSTPSFSECAGEEGASAAFADSCWWSAGTPTGMLLIALPLAQPNCAQTRAVTAALSGPSTLQVTVDHGGSCLPSPINPAASRLSLLSLAIADLPPLVLEVRVSHSGAPAAAGTTEVDLRRPVDELADPIAVAREVRQAYVRVAEDASRRYGADFNPAGIAVRRWSDAAAGCPAGGRSYERKPVHGYVVMMRMATDPRRLTVEYHGGPDSIAFCRATAPPSPSPGA